MNEKYEYTSDMVRVGTDSDRRVPYLTEDDLSDLLFIASNRGRLNWEFASYGQEGAHIYLNFRKKVKNMRDCYEKR